MQKKRTEGSLDELLLEMKWYQEVTLLASFLNLTSAELQDMYANSGIVKQKIPIGHIQQFQKDVSLTLTAIQAKAGLGELGREELQGMADYLTGKLGGARNRVVFLENLRVRVDVVTDEITDDLWADVIFLFLSRGDWMDQLGRCPQCETWFEKSRKNQVYCSDRCKSKAAYDRYRDERRSARRERYRKGETV